MNTIRTSSESMPTWREMATSPKGEEEDIDASKQEGSEDPKN